MLLMLLVSHALKIQNLHWVEKMLRHEDLQGAPLLILANKQILSEMQWEDLGFTFKPNDYTFGSLISATLSSSIDSGLCLLQQMLASVEKSGFLRDLYCWEKEGGKVERFRTCLNYMKVAIGNGLINMYAKCGAINDKDLDLAGAVSAEELARYLDLKELDERLYMFEAVSAYDGMGIKDGVDWLLEVMERSKRTEMLRVRAGVTGPISA
ncbi:hypothetical protein HHK36_027776 [Tetracentron sinense]|uniref:ADP-ribosylation factor n=1 Tax=Tetracentron sinense TaxID=13715 RepID=A0A834YFE7_TETSI|nr:hypothetical protein HHK36_027776 [Tetracentron sinense]